VVVRGQDTRMQSVIPSRPVFPAILHTGLSAGGSGGLLRAAWLQSTQSQSAGSAFDPAN
jgi:hypothetical protein